VECFDDVWDGDAVKFNRRIRRTPHMEKRTWICCVLDVRVGAAEGWRCGVEAVLRKGLMVDILLVKANA
jgi:hypothetical protein